jgi:MFS family permease
VKLSFSSFSRFRPDVRRLHVVSALMSISFFGIQALLKLLYVLRLGYGPEYLGIFNSAGAFTYMLASLPAGILGGRIGLLPAMRLGGLLTVVGMFILPMTEMMPVGLQPLWPILSQMVTTTGWALFGINLVPAFMAATSDENRNDAYALNAALRGLGTLVGTVAGGILPGLFAMFMAESLDQPGPYRMGLWVSVLVGFIAFLFLLRIKPLAASETAAVETGHNPFPVWPVGLVVLHVYLVNAGWATCQSFCNAYLDTDLRLSPAMIGLISGVGQALAVVAPLLVPRLAARRGNGWVLMVTGSLTALVMLPLVFIPHWTGASFGRSGVIALSALWMPALQVYQMETIQRHWRSLAYGVVSMAMGLSFGTVSLFGGYFAAQYGYPNLFLIGLVLCVAGAMVMWGILRRPVLVPAPRKT